ncbi:MAG: hypothetical protein L6Q57_00500 [Alphaproteobacteria bacterium]|nr:hypothetical protein [Alphaproteobacteria bacterium]
MGLLHDGIAVAKACFNKVMALNCVGQGSVSNHNGGDIFISPWFNDSIIDSAAKILMIAMDSHCRTGIQHFKGAADRKNFCGQTVLFADKTKAERMCCFFFDAENDPAYPVFRPARVCAAINKNLEEVTQAHV